MNAHPLRTGLPHCIRAIGLAWLMAAAPAAPAGEPLAPVVEPGETIAEVVAKLGRPKGSIQRRDRVTYSYDRGMVHFIDGRVVSAWLLTPEEAAKRRAEADRAAEASRRQTEAERQRQLAASQEELQKVKADAAFAKRSAAERLAYWEDFHKRYPFADVSADLAAARAAAEADSGRLTQDAELATLSARIEQIQARRVQLNADYAASLANWKRNEIDAERARLNAEMETSLQRIVELRAKAATASETAAAAASAP